MKRAFLLLPLLLLAGCPGAEPENPAVPFAKNTFTALTNGAAAVAKSIDWDHFVMGSEGKTDDIGKMLAKVQDKTERTRITTALISTYSDTVKKGGGSPDDLTDWRVKSDDPARTVVSATMVDGGFEFGISKKNNEMKLTSMRTVPKP